MIPGTTYRHVPIHIHTVHAYDTFHIYAKHVPHIAHITHRTHHPSISYTPYISHPYHIHGMHDTPHIPYHIHTIHRHIFIYGHIYIQTYIHISHIYVNKGKTSSSDNLQERCSPASTWSSSNRAHACPPEEGKGATPVWAQPHICPDGVLSPTEHHSGRGQQDCCERQHEGQPSPALLHKHLHPFHGGHAGSEGHPRCGVCQGRLWGPLFSPGRLLSLAWTWHLLCHCEDGGALPRA